MLKYAFTRRMPVQVRAAGRGASSGQRCCVGPCAACGNGSMCPAAVWALRCTQPLTCAPRCLCCAMFEQATGECALPRCRPAPLPCTVQTVISANKEAVLSELQTVARFGQTVVTGFGETVDPAKFPTFEGGRAAGQWGSLHARHAAPGCPPVLMGGWAGEHQREGGHASGWPGGRPAAAELQPARASRPAADAEACAALHPPFLLRRLHGGGAARVGR